LAAKQQNKGLATSLLAIELITGQKGILTTTKHSNIFLKIRKEIPGCKVTLRKENMFSF
jgi:ribosomal protein L5